MCRPGAGDRGNATGVGLFGEVIDELAEVALGQAVDALEGDGAGRSSGERRDRRPGGVTAGDTDPEQDRRYEAEYKSTVSHRHAPRGSPGRPIGSLRTIAAAVQFVSALLSIKPGRVSRRPRYRGAGA